jgi:hypothetical protein
MDIWNAIAGSNWTRLSSVQFIDDSCYTTASAEVERNAFFPLPVGSVRSPSISFSWTFLRERGGYPGALAGRNLGVLPTLEMSGVFAHPSVLRM